MKDPIDRTKVVLRHLPPALSQALLLQQIDSRFADRYNWFSFRPAKSCQKRQLYSRAYINFKKPEDVLEFAESFDGHTFVNEKGSQFKTIVEYAPSQRIPKPLTKKDGRDGTIYKDPEYVEFLEQLAKPIENLPSAEIQLERKEAERAGQPKEIIITTPLMDFVRQKRAAKGAPQRPSTNGKLSRRTSTASPSSSSGSAKRTSDKRKGPTSMYVLRDSTKNANKEKSPYILIRKKEDHQLSDIPSSSAADTAKDETALVRDEAVSGVDIGKGKVVLLKGRPKDSSALLLGDARQQHNLVISKQALRREANGRIIRSTDKELQQNHSTAGAGLHEQQTLSRERDKRPPRPTNIRSIVKDHISNMTAADSDPRKAVHDKAANSDLHSSSPVNERHDRRTRHRDRPDRVVWTPLRRSDGSLVGADSHSQSLTDSFEGKAGVDTEDNIVVSTPTLGGAKSRNSEARNSSTQLGRGVTGQDLGNLKDDAFPAKISEVKSLGSGRNSMPPSLENGSHRHGGRRGLAHGLMESEVTANISEGKHAARRGNTSYISHEKQVWVQKSNTGS